MSKFNINDIVIKKLNPTNIGKINYIPPKYNKKKIYGVNFYDNIDISIDCYEEELEKIILDKLIFRPEFNDIINLSNLFYRLLLENLHLFDLKKYDIDYSPDIDAITDYFKTQKINKCGIYDHYYNLLLELTKSIKYISCDEFIDIYNKNFNQLLSLSQEGYILVFIIPNIKIGKSNFYFLLYTLSLFHKLGVRIHHIYENIDNILSNIVINNKILLIITDDFSYSGSQINNNLKKFIITLDEHEYEIKYFLNIIGLTQLSKKNIIESLQYKKILIIPKHIIYIDETNKSYSIESFLDNYLKSNFGDLSIKVKNAKLNITDIIYLLDVYNLNITEKSIKFEDTLFDFDYMFETGNLIYLFSKYPDATSVVQQLCRIKINNKPSLNINKFIKEFNLDIIQFIKLFKEYKNLKDILIKVTNNDIAECIINEITNSYLSKVYIPYDWIEWCDRIKDKKYIINYDNYDLIKTIINIDYSKKFNKKNNSFSLGCHDIIPAFYNIIEYRLDSILLNNEIKIKNLQEFL
jgi:hypothetical protein